MTRDDIIKMASEAGFTPQRDEWLLTEMLERFATIVTAAAKAEEREACAKECEEVDANPHVVLHHAVVCATAIRARGQA